MRFHFLRLYLVFFLAAGSLIFGFSEIYKHFFAQPLYHTIDVERIFEGLQANRGPEYKVLHRSELDLGSALLDKLGRGELVAYRVRHNYYYLRALDQERLVMWGPVAASDWKTIDWEPVLLLFYMALALIILLLLRPLFRDINHLIDCTEEFARRPARQSLDTPESSSVYPLARALYNMSNELLEQMQSHKDLANIMAHELRTPLARMKFCLKAVSEGLPEKYLVRLQADINELDKLAHNYLEFGRSQRADADYFLPVPLTALAHDLQEKFAGVEPPLTVVLRAGVGIVECNAVQLELALTNLINNALRFARAQVQLTIECDGRQLNLRVDDDGPGFSAPAGTDQHLSFGLGLYVVRQVALRHGGVMRECMSELGGACVRLELPCVPYRERLTGFSGLSG